MKSILFVINTLGVGGGEKALLEVLKQINSEKYEVSLFVLTGQGELIRQVPESVKLLNNKYFPISVLDHGGRIRLIITVMKALFVKGIIFKRIGYIRHYLFDMIKKGNILPDKLFWKILSDGAQRLEQEYDLAVAYLEGGAAYYVSSYVKSKKKVVFIHTDYILAGYNRGLDEDCYLNYDNVFTISENVKERFLSVYPECRKYTDVFFNRIDREGIISKAKVKGGFSDCYNGFRILTVGRLVPEKIHDIAIQAMKILKSTGGDFRWYVLGEGVLRKKLERTIKMLGLEKEFFLLGAVDNPFPYYAQCDLYVHTTLLEGKSVAVQEAQILGCPILVTEYNGVCEQIEDGVSGKICKPEPEVIAENILYLVNHPWLLKSYREAALEKSQTDNQREVEKLIRMLAV